LKILSYNVNGIRAAFNKGFIEWLQATDADIICIQETKALKEQVDTELLDKLGYYHYWFSAQKKGIVAWPFFPKSNQKMYPMEVKWSIWILKAASSEQILMRCQ
jgi:exonuclease III